MATGRQSPLVSTYWCNQRSLLLQFLRFCRPRPAFTIAAGLHISRVLARIRRETASKSRRSCGAQILFCPRWKALLRVEKRSHAVWNLESIGKEPRKSPAAAKSCCLVASARFPVCHIHRNPGRWLESSCRDSIPASQISMASSDWRAGVLYAVGVLSCSCAHRSKPFVSVVLASLPAMGGSFRCSIDRDECPTRNRRFARGP